MSGSHVFNGILLRQPLRTEKMATKSSMLLPPLGGAPPNTPYKRAKKIVTFPETGGMPGTLRWGGSDDDRSAIRKRKTPPLTYRESPDYIHMTVPRRDASKLEKPDYSTYSTPWHPESAGYSAEGSSSERSTLAQQLERWSPRKRQRSSADGFLYSKTPPAAPVDEAGHGSARVSNSSARVPNSKTLMKLKRPGVLETLNAADRAVSFIRVSDQPACAKGGGVC